ncbi:hypothetical protein [Pseudomonas sp. OA65]|uniref:hypothetical protein n=1 Tax=Pseudomonas sp. OA65 TaxID=2818431 RepID=UPI001A9E123A|nr:hypothetical protein [Pseudomonas sp. OA65]MBO1539612.1 hypothetical protein [Pseudomonas sp. OA65]
MWYGLVTLLKSVPDVIWSGIVASCITLIGVMLSNRSNNARLKLQLDHDAREKSKEKISNLRREVYLKAVEDIEVTNIHVGSLASRDLSTLTMNSELQAITASMAKLKLVAEPKTTQLAGELSVAFGVLFLKLLQRLLPVQDAKADIEINDTGYISSSAEASRILREMHKFNEEGRQDAVIFQTLQNSYEFFSNQAQDYADARSTAYDVYNARLGEFNKLLMPDMKELSKMQLKLMMSIRNDLGIVCDIPALEQQLERQWTVMGAEFGNTMDLFREKPDAGPG